MAFSVNRITLLGNLTRDPELRYTAGGTPVCTVNMATNRSIKDENSQGGWKDVATFHRVIVWGKAAERASKLAKGAKVYVEGRMDNRSYEVQGVKKYVSEVVAEQLIDLTGKKSEPTTAAPAAAPQDQGDGEPTEPTDPSENVDPDDIPF